MQVVQPAEWATYKRANLEDRYRRDEDPFGADDRQQLAVDEDLERGRASRNRNRASELSGRLRIRLAWVDIPTEPASRNKPR